MLRLIFLTSLIAISVTLNAQSKIRLIGFDAGYEYSWYDKIFSPEDGFKKEHLQDVVPGDYIFYDEIGSPYKFVFDPARPGKKVPHMDFQKSDEKKINISGILQIKSNGQFSQHHLFKVGLSYASRNFLSGDFRRQIGPTQIDTAGTVVYYNDTLQVYTYNYTIGISNANNNVKQLKVNAAYQYSISPMDKFNVLVGAGINLGYAFRGTFRGQNIIYNATESLANGTQAGMFYNIYNSNQFNNKYSRGFSVSPYADITVNWRLSKTNKSLDNINLFATARMGYDCIKLKQSKTYGDLFVSTTFGISYIFDKYYKS